MDESDSNVQLVVRRAPEGIDPLRKEYVAGVMEDGRTWTFGVTTDTAGIVIAVRSGDSVTYYGIPLADLIGQICVMDAFGL